MPPSEPNRTLDAIWRMEAPRLIAGLARLVRDVGVAEELAQDALVAALEHWPVAGVPEKPGAWLLATARRRALDVLRRRRRLRPKHDEIGRELSERERIVPDLTAAADDEIGDDLLRLIFTACHPVLPREGRVALTLRLLAGLTTEEIARAFLVSEATLAQRLVRAKRTLAAARVPFEVPRGAELAGRLASVLEVLYLLFNEGYAASAGDHWLRPALCEEALRLGRVLAELLPREPEVHGLVALLELQASRTRARTDAAGAPVLLLDQDRGRWDWLLIRRGLAGLARAERLRAGSGAAAGPYELQAALAACHARARIPEDTDWPRIVALYDALLAITGSPLVALNRAVALSRVEGPAAALAEVDELAGVPALAGYHRVPAVRADLLERLGHLAAARGEYERAAQLTANLAERRLLAERAAHCARRFSVTPEPKGDSRP